MAHVPPDKSLEFRQFELRAIYGPFTGPDRVAQAVDALRARFPSWACGVRQGRDGSLEFPALGIAADAANLPAPAGLPGAIVAGGESFFQVKAALEAARAAGGYVPTKELFQAMLEAMPGDDRTRAHALMGLLAVPASGCALPTGAAINGRVAYLLEAPQGPDDRKTRYRRFTLRGSDRKDTAWDVGVPVRLVRPA